MAAVMREMAVVRRNTADFPFAGGSETVNSISKVFADAFARDDVIAKNFSAEKFDTVFDWGFGLLSRVNRETKRGNEAFDFRHIFENESREVSFGNDDEEIVDIAAVIFVPESDGNEAVELIEKDVGKLLRSEVADDEAAAFELVEKGFFGR